MSLLTHTEITECLTGGPTTVARNIEAAVIKKLAAGVDVEPFRTDADGEEVYVVHQLHTAIATARVMALNEAAKAIHNLPSNSERCADLQLPLQAWDEALEDAERAVLALIRANK